MAIEVFDIPRFYYAKASAIAVGDTYAQVVNLSTPALDPGVYMIGYAFEYTLAEKSKRIAYRVTGTFGSATEFDLSVPAELVGLTNNKAYSFPKEHLGGVIDLGMEFKKDASLSGATITFVDVMVVRVG